MTDLRRLDPAWRAFLAWRRAAEPFGQYVFAAPFFGRLDPSHPQALSPSRRADRILRAALPVAPAPAEACLIDLDPHLSLGGLGYLRRLSGRIVPLIARWPAEPGILPTQTILRRLVEQAPGPRERIAPIGSPIFLLDGSRGGPAQPVSARQLEQRFDNRYQYQIDYLPPGPRLVEAGIRHIIWISEVGAATGDVLDYERRLIRSGLTIDHRRATAARQTAQRGG